MPFARAVLAPVLSLTPGRAHAPAPGMGEIAWRGRYRMMRQENSMASETPGQTPARKPVRPKGWAGLQSPFVYRLAQALCYILFRFWVRYYRFIGTERVPAEGGGFLVANHTTGMDPFLVGYPVKQRMIRGPGKIELFAHPFWGWLMRKLGIFPLRQDVADAAAVRTMVELYRAGQMVAVFPEGGRSKTGELQEFNPGFTRLVIKLKAPVTPVAVAGGTELLPIGKLIPRRHSPVTVIYGEPFDLSEFYGQELTPPTLERATNKMRDQVAGLLVVAHTERAMLNGRR